MEENQNWINEFQRSFKNARDLYEFLGWELSDELSLVAKTYSLFVPYTLAEKIKTLGPESILAREFLPHKDELKGSGLIDPIGDKNFHKAPQLIHRYSSRALFTPTTVCPVHCRYCFRKNELNPSDELFQQDFEKTLSYLKEHSEISELIFTGGDPFTLSNEKLEKYLMNFSEIRSLKDIRFHTRYPAIFPERIDSGLIEVLKRASSKFRTLTIAIHANHVQEFDEKSKAGIKKLSETGAQLLSQTVLLKNINDNKKDLLDLMELFIELKVRPYYLHHPDQVKGGMHFYLPLEDGRRIYHEMRNHLPGWALPQYVIDIPGGHGKITAMNPETTTFSGQLLSKDGDTITLQGPDFFI